MMMFANILVWLHRALDTAWITSQLEKEKSLIKCVTSIEHKLHYASCLLADESGSPWRSIDWVWEQYNKVGTVWQEAKWQRHVEPRSIEPNISSHNRKWQRHFQRGEKNCNMHCALVQLLHVIWKLNNFIWQCSLPVYTRRPKTAWH